MGDDIRANGENARTEAEAAETQTFSEPPPLIELTEQALAVFIGRAIAEMGTGAKKSAELLSVFEAVYKLHERLCERGARDAAMFRAGQDSVIKELAQAQAQARSVVAPMPPQHEPSPGRGGLTTHLGTLLSPPWEQP